jgi:hypothetical protein
MSDFSVIAIVAAYNEADIIGQVVGYLIAQGIQVYFLDDGSTDGTVAAIEPYVGRGVLCIERLTGAADNAAPRSFAWERILLRKTELARQLDADWFVHHDADEFREAPWAHASLLEGIRRVDALGFNAIDFSSLDFWPIDDTFQPGDDVRAAFPFYSEHAPYDHLQIRCWKKTDDIDLASSGGHEACFDGRRVFPLRFILRHYPIRGQRHGERKIFAERQKRFLDEERARGWHVQYDDVQKGGSFLRDPASLLRYDADAVRVGLALRHRGVEALEASLLEMRAINQAQQEELVAREQEVARRGEALARSETELARSRSELAARNAEAVRLGAELSAHAIELAGTRRQLEDRHADLDAHRAEIAKLADALERRGADVESLSAAVHAAERRLDELHRSLSWRWMSPARAIYRLLRLGKTPRTF